MKRIFLLGLLLLSWSFATAEEFRTWKTIAGGHFEAKIIGSSASSVTLANREGKRINFPIADLKPSDRSYIREWQSGKSTSSGVTELVEVERSDFAELVYRDLVYAKGKRLKRFQAQPTDDPKYFAFYRSALWCPPCRKFTPKLVDFYDEQKRKGAAFELIFVSSDRDEDSMAEYMSDYDMEWPAFPLGKNKGLVSSNGRGIPNLIITDAEGNKLLDSYDETGGYIGPTRVMAEFEKLLAR